VSDVWHAGSAGRRLEMPHALIEGLTLSGASRVHERYLDAVCRGRQEPFTAELFARSAREGATVVDGGAYLGFYTLLAARRVGMEGTVFAFEPNPDTFELLRQNVRENDLVDRVVALPVGICAAPTRRPFYIGRGDGAKSSLFVPERWREATETECTSLDDALGARPVDLVKLDIEGGEVEALRGMRRTLASSPDPCVIVECNPAALGRAGTSARTLLRELDAAGLEATVIDDEDWELRAIDEAPLPRAGHVNLYCRRR
jgi:FkbM family methyltransferase